MKRITKQNIRIVIAGRKNRRAINGQGVNNGVGFVRGSASEGDIEVSLDPEKLAIASLKELWAIILVKDIKPDPMMIMKAGEQGIPVPGTKEGTFTLPGKFYRLLN